MHWNTTVGGKTKVITTSALRAVRMVKHATGGAGAVTHISSRGLPGLLPPLLGCSLVVVLWTIVSHVSAIPGPMPVWNTALKLFSNFFYRHFLNGPGICWNIARSVTRVGVGARLAALASILFGVMAGRRATQVVVCNSRSQAFCRPSSGPHGCRPIQRAQWGTRRKRRVMS